MAEARRRLAGDIPPDTELAFDAWARWARHRPLGLLPSPAWLMMQSKRVGVPARSTRGEPEMPPEVLAVDCAVARVKLEERQLARVFSVYYLEHAPVEIKAARCRLGPWYRPDVRKFYRLLYRARLRVSGEFSRIAENLDSPN